MREVKNPATHSTPPPSPTSGSHTVINLWQTDKADYEDVLMNYLPFVNYGDIVDSVIVYCLHFT